MKRTMFIAELEELFDIGHSQISLMRDIPAEDTAFLQSQRDDLAQSSIGGIERPTDDEHSQPYTEGRYGN